jgi:very-short-patch-repair endonuclease
MARALDGAIAELAPTTLGLLTTLQLDSLGCTRQMRRTLVACGVLVPLGGGVFRHGAHPRSWHQDALAAVLVAGPGGVASHLTAAVLWAFDEIAPGPIEVTVPRARAPRRVPATVHRVDLGPADIGEPYPDRPRGGARRAGARDGPRRRGARPRHLAPAAPVAPRPAAARTRPPRPGPRALTALLDRTEGRDLGDDWLEQETIRILDRARLPRPRTQVHRDKHGGGIARVDLWWDEARLVAEVEGHRTHSSRRHRQADHERAARLGLTEHRVIGFTYEDVRERPHHVVGIIRAYLEAA